MTPSESIVPEEILELERSLNDVDLYFKELLKHAKEKDGLSSMTWPQELNSMCNTFIASVGVTRGKILESIIKTDSEGMKKIDPNDFLVILKNFSLVYWEEKVKYFEKRLAASKADEGSHEKNRLLSSVEEYKKCQKKCQELLESLEDGWWDLDVSKPEN